MKTLGRQNFEYHERFSNVNGYNSPSKAVSSNGSSSDLTQPNRSFVIGPNKPSMPVIVPATKNNQYFKRSVNQIKENDSSTSPFQIAQFQTIDDPNNSTIINARDNSGPSQPPSNMATLIEYTRPTFNKIGRFKQKETIEHDVEISDFVTPSPGEYADQENQSL